MEEGRKENYLRWCKEIIKAKRCWCHNTHSKVREQFAKRVVFGLFAIDLIWIFFKIAGIIVIGMSWY